jgi:hypothetical protein
VSLGQRRAPIGERRRRDAVRAAAQGRLDDDLSADVDL